MTKHIGRVSGDISYCSSSGRLRGWREFLLWCRGNGVSREKSEVSEGLHNAESCNADGKDVGIAGWQN